MTYETVKKVAGQAIRARGAAAVQGALRKQFGVGRLSELRAQDMPKAFRLFVEMSL